MIIDDKSARYFAESMMLKSTGLIGLLLLAKENDIIEQLKPHLDSLIGNGYRISLKLHNSALSLSKEIKGMDKRLCETIFL